MSAIVPVPEQSLPEHYKLAMESQKRSTRREKSYSAVKSMAILLLGGGCAFLTWRNEQLVKLAADNANRVIYNTIRDDGLLMNSAVYTALPAKFQTDNTLNTLWWYVQWRECYNASEAPRAHYAVQRMSDDRVAKEWRQYIDQRNPNSPQVALGKKGAYYSCDPVQYTPIGRDGDRYGFRFMRYEVDNRGQRDRGIMMYAPLAFRTGIYDSGPDGWRDRVVFNAAGVQVWEYRGAEPEAVQSHLMVNAGAQR